MEVDKDKIFRGNMCLQLLFISAKSLHLLLSFENNLQFTKFKQMPVIKSKSIYFFLKLLNFKKIVEYYFNNPPRSKKLVYPSSFSRLFHVYEFFILKHAVVTIQPKIDFCNIHVLYFHGGGYVLEGNSMHWKIVQNIASNTKCRVSYIDYPLAPDNNYITTFEMVQLAFNKLTTDYPNDVFVFIGDSAGGGLALALAQKLFLENATIQPVKNILFSPWLDITMQNPAIRMQEKLDYILPYNGLKVAGKKYVGDADPNHYLVSPINGRLDGIGKTLVFYGTQELFYPDCVMLKEKTAGFGNFFFEEFEGMQHDWVIFPIPEANDALNKAMEFMIS